MVVVNICPPSVAAELPYLGLDTVWRQEEQHSSWLETVPIQGRVCSPPWCGITMAALGAAPWDTGSWHRECLSPSRAAVAQQGWAWHITDSQAGLAGEEPSR